MALHTSSFFFSLIFAFFYLIKAITFLSKYYMVKALKEKDYLILLIDTEGFGALDTDSNHDVRIFT